MKLKKIKFENWRGFRGITELGLAGVRGISGRNGIGKTTFADAVSYVLCGCNASGVADFETRPVTDGVPMCGALYAVTLEVEHNGEVTTLTRGVRDVETRKRGSSEVTWKSEGVREVDGVPVSVAEFDATIAKWCGGQTAKGLTFSDWIFTLPVAQRRAYLLGLVDSAEQAKIQAQAAMATENICTEFKEGETPAQYKKRVMAHVSEMKKERDANTAKIEENFAGISNADATEADAKIKEAEELVKSLKTETASDTVKQLLGTINKLAAEQNEYLAKVRGENNEKIAKAKEAKNKASYTIDDLAHSIKRSDGDIKDLDIKHAEAVKGFEAAKMAYTEARQRLHAVPEVPIICPYCGEPIAEHKRAEIEQSARQEANHVINAHLQIILRDAEEKKSKIAEIDKRITDLAAERERLKGLIEVAKEQRDEAQREIDRLTAENDLADATDYMTERYDQIDAARRQIKQIEEAGELDRKAKEDKISEAQQQIREAQKLKAQAEEDDRKRKRVLELQERNAVLADEIVAAEQKKIRAEEYERLLAEGVTDSVNAKFPANMKWKFAEAQVNGGINDVAELYVDGVNIKDVNYAKKLVSKLAVTVALQDAFGVSLPIFVDNAESVNDFPEYPNRQVIALAVSDQETITLY